MILNQNKEVMRSGISDLDREILADFLLSANNLGSEQLIELHLKERSKFQN